PGASMSGEELVQEIAVAVLDVHEFGSDIARHQRRSNVIVHQPLQFVVGENLCVSGDTEFAIEDGMPEGDARLQSPVVWAAEAARVGELEPDERISGAWISLRMRLDQRFSQARDAGLVFPVNDELVGICAAVVANGHRLATPNQL